MKKDITKNEMIEEIELNEEVQAEELTEETLENVDGGCWIYVAAFLVGAYAGDQINKLRRK